MTVKLLPLTCTSVSVYLVLQWCPGLRGVSYRLSVACSLIFHRLCSFSRVDWQEELVQLWFGHTLLSFADCKQKEFLPSVASLFRIHTSSCDFLVWTVSACSSRRSFQPRSHTLQSDSLPGKTKNTGVGSLSLLWGIFPTQEWNQSLLHWRQSLYQLSYQGSLHKTIILEFSELLYTGS